MKHSKFPFIVLVPILVLLFVFTMLPILGSFGISVLDYNPLRSEGNSFVGVANYKNLLKDSVFLISLKNTAVFVVLVVCINLVITLPVSQLLVSLRSNKFRSAFRVAFFMPCVAPLAAVTIVWGRCILPTKGGLLNMLINLFGGASINWMDATHLMSAIIILSLWADVGYNIILFVSGIEGVPAVYYEAAEIDGAGPIRRFFNITLPLLNRTFVYVLSTTIISQAQAFAQFQIMAKGGGPNNAGYVLSTYIYYEAFNIKDYGYASAISVILFLLIMIVTLVERKATKADWGY